MGGGQERALRGRIRSVQATKKITRAMELIAASRIVKAQQRVQAAVPYSEQITEVVKDLAAAGAGKGSPLLAGRDQVKNTCYVVIAADRGLCGGYNAGVQRAAEGEIKADVLAGRGYAIVAVGRKPDNYFRFRGYNRTASFGGFSDSPTYENAREIGKFVVKLFLDGDVDKVELVYTRFISAGSQEVVLRPLVPLETTTVDGGDGKAAGGAGDYEFEPDPSTILDTLLPRYVEARIYAALLNAAASEYAFKQRAMKSATDNAEELIKNLARIMNRARQDSITTEIMEIVSGAEALGGGKAKNVRYVEMDMPSFTASAPVVQKPQSFAAVAPAPRASAVSVLDADKLQDIVGIGPVIDGKLKSMGITTFAQIAAWSDADAQRIGAELDFPGRIERENWITQAREFHGNKYGE
jgi:F-type H+-transporting ATPase subunit gamma